MRYLKLVLTHNHIPEATFELSIGARMSPTGESEERRRGPGLERIFEKKTAGGKNPRKMVFFPVGFSWSFFPWRKQNRWAQPKTRGRRNKLRKGGDDEEVLMRMMVFSTV